jgi:translation initiation factor 2B subunit (eIF-2B alpha/beta/delta family)
MFSFYRIIEELDFPDFKEAGDKASKSKMGKLYWTALGRLSSTDQYSKSTPEEIHDEISKTAKKIYRKEQTMFSFYKVVEALEGIFRSDPKERIQTLQKHIKDCEIAKKNCPRLVKLHSKEWGHEYSDLKSCYGHWNDEISSSGEEIQKLK